MARIRIYDFDGIASAPGQANPDPEAFDSIEQLLALHCSLGLTDLLATARRAFDSLSARTATSLDELGYRLSFITHLHQLAPDAIYERAIRSTVEEIKGYYDSEQGLFRSKSVESTDAPSDIYTYQNMLVSIPLIEAHAVLGGAEWRGMAVSAIAWCCSEMYLRGGMAHTLRAGQDRPEPELYLFDQAWSILALIYEYELTGRNTYLFRAQGLANWVLKDFESESSPLKGQNASALDGRKPDPARELAILTIGLVRLARLLREERYGESAERILNAALSGVGDDTVPLLELARDELEGNLLRVSIVSPHPDPSGQELINAALAEYGPGKLVEWLAPLRDDYRIRQLGLPRDSNRPAAFVIGREQAGPIQDASELRQAIRQAR